MCSSIIILFFVLGEVLPCFGKQIVGNGHFVSKGPTHLMAAGTGAVIVDKGISGNEPHDFQKVLLGKVFLVGGLQDLNRVRVLSSALWLCDTFQNVAHVIIHVVLGILLSQSGHSTVGIVDPQFEMAVVSTLLGRGKDKIYIGVEFMSRSVGTGIGWFSPVAHMVLKGLLPSRSVINENLLSLINVLQRHKVHGQAIVLDPGKTRYGLLTPFRVTHRLGPGQPCVGFLGRMVNQRCDNPVRTEQQSRITMTKTIIEQKLLSNRFQCVAVNLAIAVFGCCHVVHGELGLVGNVNEGDGCHQPSLGDPAGGKGPPSGSGNGRYSVPDIVGALTVLLQPFHGW